MALFLVFSIAAAALAPLVFSKPLEIFDEGFVASGAMLIRQGALPIRDFYVIYGPGQYYLTAGAFELFGEDLLVSRALHVLLLALLGAAVAACSWVLMPRSRLWPVLTALAYLFAAGTLQINSGYASIPAALLLLGGCLMYAQWTETGAKTSLLAASSLAGLAGFFRWDFGIFGLVALTITTSGLLFARHASRSSAGRSIATAVMPGLVLIMVAFVPFIIAGDAVRWFNEVPGYFLTQFKTWRNLEFVRPALWNVKSSWMAGNLLAPSGDVVRLAYVAAAPCAALAAIMIALRRIWLKRCMIGGADAMALLLGLTTLFLMNQMRVRAGFPQGFPALVASLPLIGYVVTAIPAQTPTQRGALAALSATLAITMIVAPLYLMQDRVREALVNAVSSGGTELPKATLMRSNGSTEQKRWDEYVDLVRHVRTTTQQGEPILSAVADTSRLFVNDAMLYFLADRPAATRWVEMEPGLTNTEHGQRELIASLETRNVRTVVLLALKVDEPNATSRSNGIHLFDKYLHRTFVSTRKFGRYEVLVRRGT